jgi:glycosyltransferase involved in cell wall biosynthesis
MLPLLREKRIIPTFLILTWGDEGGPLVEFLGENGITFQAVPCHPTSTERVRWILECVAGIQPDIFVPNLVVPAYYASRWVRSTGIPTVGVLHSDDPFYRGIQEEFFLGDPRYAVSALVCVSRKLEEQVAGKNSRHTRVLRIPYGVPIPPVKIHSFRPPALRIAYVGRLAEEQKRISLVTRALCRVVREVADTEAVLYGDGPERDQVELILQSEGAGLPVRLAGRIPSEEIQTHLQDCDVVILLSDYEGLPIALLEAMACGCVPVCLRMRSGIPELVQDGVTGLLVEDRDKGFVEAIRRLRGNPDFLAELSANARAKVKEEFSIEANADAWAALLTELAEKSSGKRAIRIPHRIKLPPVHPALAAEDPREETMSLAKAFSGKMRKSLGLLKRCLRS